MFKTGTLGDYLGVPTRRSYFATSTSASSSISACTSDASIPLVSSSYSWDSIVSNLVFNMKVSEIPGVSCAKNYDNSSTVLLKSSVPLKIQRYRNANLRFGIVNSTNRDYIAHGLLVGIAPGNTIVRTWKFSVPIDSKKRSCTGLC